MVFQERVAEEKAKAEIEFNKRVAEGREEGEKMCTEMITVACQNVTLGSSSDEFCEVSDDNGIKGVVGLRRIHSRGSQFSRIPAW